MSVVRDFTFVTITYNHAKYIIEHLESIKFIVEEFGSEIDVTVIVADDGSRDDTVVLCRLWFDRNAQLFKKVLVLSDGVNRGTCKNLTRALQYLETDYCKVTAGDDVYSFENLFLGAKEIDDNNIVSGLPLNLIDGTLMNTRFVLFNLFATNLIYKESSYLTRLKKINFFNSPNISYAISILRNKEVISFVDQYAVTEDYPLQVKMAELYAPIKFLQLERVFVYYRRTSNSTYLVKNLQFNQDKLKLFDHLIASESDVFGRFLLRNRVFCFNLQNQYLKRVLNLNYYLYGFSVLLRIFQILKKLVVFDAQLDQHQMHYDLIASRARVFLTEAAQTAMPSLMEFATGEQVSQGEEFGTV
jgi:glycosyltransferase involved in cell wall biosynthesis